MRHFYKYIDRYLVGIIIGVLLQCAAFFIIGDLSDDAHIVWSALDDAIPFCVPFVVPYVTWFFYILAGFISFWHFHRQSAEDHSEFVRIMWLMGLGLLFCAVFYIIYPTRIPFEQVRPDLSQQKGVFNWLMNFVYQRNVSNNALPSEHCYVSMVLCLGFLRAPALKKSKHRFWVYPASVLLSVSIVAATVFTKQHSILDFFAASVLFIVLSIIVYYIPWRKKRNV